MPLLACTINKGIYQPAFSGSLNIDVAALIMPWRYFIVAVFTSVHVTEKAEIKLNLMLS